jgi:hypothetical protein
MAEWFKAAVLKTAVVAIPPWVRIPLSPPPAWLSGIAAGSTLRTRVDVAALFPAAFAVVLRQGTSPAGLLRQRLPVWTSNAADGGAAAQIAPGRFVRTGPLLFHCDNCPLRTSGHVFPLHGLAAGQPCLSVKPDDDSSDFKRRLSLRMRCRLSKPSSHPLRISASASFQGIPESSRSQLSRRQALHSCQVSPANTARPTRPK